VIGDTGRVSYPGQVIGCDYTNATSVAKDTEAFLFVGGGRFHALGVALSTSKPTIVADPYDMTTFSVNKDAERIRRQRWTCIKEAQKARIFAVLIGLKQGQERMEEALQIKEKLAENGRTTYLFAARNITPEALMNFPRVDAFINTACPRLTLDDANTFRRPILTINEALVAIGELSWGELCQKGLLER
jgi:2-(3-amino-3-carboxypropyl)histidine synthase